MAEVACFYETESYWSADWISVPHKSLAPGSPSVGRRRALYATSPCARCTPSYSSLTRGYLPRQASARALWSNTHTCASVRQHWEVVQAYTNTHTLTCPNTSSLTVKVRSSMSSMSLSFIHWRLWWNSSSRYSRSLRSHGLHTRINKYMWTWSNGCDRSNQTECVSLVQAPRISQRNVKVC